MAGILAGCFALSAFVIAIAAGLWAGNPASTILLRALVAMAVCWPAGLAVAVVARRGGAAQADPPAQTAQAQSPEAPAPPAQTAREEVETSTAVADATNA